MIVVWKVLNCSGYHNHALTHYPDGQRRISSLDDAELLYVRSQFDAEVSPKKVSLGLHQRSPLKPQISMKSLYNAAAKWRAEGNGDRNAAQQTLLLANEHGYSIYFEKNPETNQITHIFMSHPDGRRLFRAYPYVALIDSTYKTNRYLMPFVEIVGVSPVGKTFVIAYALVNQETTEGYEWVLQRLQMLLPNGVVPNAIVTDRELGLIAAIPKVFPESQHLLCVWHIKCAVEVVGTLTSKKNAGMGKAIGKEWQNRVVKAPTIAAFMAAMDRFRIKWPKMIAYLDNTWLKEYNHMFLHCATNLIRHYGNTATSRAESAHAVLKDWLDTSNKGLDRLWRSVHGMLEGQYKEIRIALEHSRSNKVVDSCGRLFSLLGGKVALHAIELMKEELERGFQLGAGLRNGCGCVMQSTHGLLCACQLHNLWVTNRRVRLNQIDVFWRTLTFDGREIIIPTDNDLLEEYIEMVRNCDEPTRRRVLEGMRDGFHPEEEDVEEPAVKQTRRGRPKKSTTRNKSNFEHVRNKYGNSGTDAPSHTPNPISFESIPGAPLELNYQDSPPSEFGYQYCVPPLVDEYIEAWFDPSNDGHCGYHVISHAFTGVQTNHMVMRVMLSDELGDPRYCHAYDLDDYNRGFGRINCTIPGVIGDAHWMDSQDCNGYATLFNWVICVISSVSRNNGRGRTYQGSATYMPLWGRRGITEPVGVMWILHTGNHFVRLRMESDCPMPPLSYEWNTWHDDSVHHYPGYYAEQLGMWYTYFDGQ